MVDTARNAHDEVRKRRNWQIERDHGGTITGVTAGDGLSGGGTSGVVELDIAPLGVVTAMLDADAVTEPKISATGLASGRFLKWNGAALVWAAPSAGSGTISTQVYVGHGDSGHVVVFAAPVKFAICDHHGNGRAAVQRGDTYPATRSKAGTAWLTNGILYNYASLRSSHFKWTASGSGTDEWYLEESGGGDPSIAEPTTLDENGSVMSIGTMGSLAVGEWDWGDNDTLGYSTVYVRLTATGDPDLQAAGWVTTEGITLGNHISVNQIGQDYSLMAWT